MRPSYMPLFLSVAGCVCVRQNLVHEWPLRNCGATNLRNVTDARLYILYNTVTVSVHSNNNGTSIDVAVGFMQGSIV